MLILYHVVAQSFFNGRLAGVFGNKCDNTIFNIDGNNKVLTTSDEFMNSGTV